MSVVETVVKQFTSFLETSTSLKITDQSQRQYLTKLAETYFNGEIEQKELHQYIEELSMQKEACAKVIAKLYQLKEKSKVIKAPIQNKPVEQTKPVEPIAKTEKKQTEKQTDQKSKIFDRIKQAETGKKKVKTQKGQQGKRSPKKQTEAEVKEQQGAQKKNLGLKQQVEASGKKKCRFFPFCRSMETGDCPFFHPTDKCTYFPNCKFGQDCLYVHEACKFKEACKKDSCPYAHPFRKNSNNIAMALQALIKNQNPLKMSRKPKQPRKQRQEQN